MIVHLEAEAGRAVMDLRDEEEHSQKWWAKNAFYEISMLDWIRRHYHGGTFIDVGSCIGNHTIYFALFCDARVLSIEPVTDCVAHQICNIELNGIMDRVILEQCAVSDRPSRGRMEDTAPDWHHTVMMHQLVEDPAGDVEVRPLDSIVEQYQLADVTLVKIDVEGYELQALRGAQNLINAQRPVLFIEAAEVDYLWEIDGFLKPWGYYINSHFNPTPTYEFSISKRGPHRGRTGR
jgi:FkbM family methyltransferase